VEQLGPGHEHGARGQALAEEFHAGVHPAQDVPGLVQLVLTGEVGLWD
jgi:hypothetical protein